MRRTLTLVVAPWLLAMMSLASPVVAANDDEPVMSKEEPQNGDEQACDLIAEQDLCEAQDACVFDEGQNVCLWQEGNHPDDENFEFHGGGYPGRGFHPGPGPRPGPRPGPYPGPRPGPYPGPRPGPYPGPGPGPGPRPWPGPGPIPVPVPVPVPIPAPYPRPYPQPYPQPYPPPAPYPNPGPNPGYWCDPYTHQCYPYCTNGSNNGGGWGYQPELGGPNGSCRVPY